MDPTRRPGIRILAQERDSDSLTQGNYEKVDVAISTQLPPLVTTYQLPPSSRDRAIDARSSMAPGGEAAHGHDGPGRTRAQRVSRGRVPPRRDAHRVQRRPPRTPKMGMPPRHGETSGDRSRIGGESSTPQRVERCGDEVTGMGDLIRGHRDLPPAALPTTQYTAAGPRII